MDPPGRSSRERKGWRPGRVFPLIEILAALPDAPVSVEVPDVAVESHGITDHFHTAAATLTSTADTETETIR